MSILTIMEWPISTPGGPFGLAVDGEDRAYFSGGPAPDAIMGQSQGQDWSINIWPSSL